MKLRLGLPLQPMQDALGTQHTNILAINEEQRIAAFHQLVRVPHMTLHGTKNINEHVSVFNYVRWYVASQFEPDQL